MTSKTVLVFGTFDQLHPGHRFVLDAAQEKGGMHVIVARDKTVERIKGHTTQQSQQERIEAVQKIYTEAVVHLGDESDYMRPVRDIAPDLIVMGYDQQLPPGVNMEDLPCPVERLEAFEPERYKSSILRESQDPSSGENG